MIVKLCRRDFLVSTTASAAGFLACSPAWPRKLQNAPASSRENLLLDHGWRFHEGDVPFAGVLSQDETYDAVKTGNASGAAATSFDDSDWQLVQLPHDFVSFQPIEADANPAQGYRRRGVSWYRNTLYFPLQDMGKHIELQIGAAATEATVWFNGTVVARNFSGYNAITIDLTPFAVYGDAPNTLAVRVDANAMEGWWYEGGGLYRDVRVVKRHAVHITTDGVYADPVKTSSGWTIPNAVTLASTAATDTEVRVEADLCDDSGRAVVTATATARVPALGSIVVPVPLAYSAPRQWSPDEPNLYEARVRLIEKDAVVDETATVCGFRTICFDPGKGLFLNGLPLKVQGVCLHQDHAGVGTAVPDALWEFRIRRLKELGCNAVRSSHNAPSSVMLDLCDRYGLLVMDENRRFNPAPEGMAELEWMVRRDRNHPSVFLWSVFNEEPMQGTAAGREMVRRMVHAVKALDPVRPVTAAMNGGFFNPESVAEAVDVVGFNYSQGSYDAFHAAHPSLPLISSEDTSAFMMRGEYETDPARHCIDSYDEQAAIDTHRKAWRMIAERPFIAGGFVWTGFDYHGEPKPGFWPTNSSNFGILDLCGFDKAAAYIHQAQWVKNWPVLKLIPHWDWPGREGKPVKVMVMSNLDEVELLLNGRVLGRQNVDPYAMNTWAVDYAPGILEAVGYRGAVVVARTKVETTSEAVALKVVPDRAEALADGRDAIVFRIEAVDAKGRVRPLAKHPVRFTVQGGDIIGLGNGDPNSPEPEKGDRRSLYNGLAQVIVRTQQGTHRRLFLRAVAPGLKPARGMVRLLPSAPPRQQVGASVQVLNWWYQAPRTASRADSVAKFADDLHVWPDFGGRGLLDPLPLSGYCLCSAEFTPHVRVQRQGGLVDFFTVCGSCEVYDGPTLIARKDDAAESRLQVSLMPRAGLRRLNVIFRVEAGKPFGFRTDVMVKPLEAQSL
jgi:beta-galactosidase